MQDMLCLYFLSSNPEKLFCLTYIVHPYTVAMYGYSQTYHVAAYTASSWPAAVTLVLLFVQVWWS